VPQSAPNSSLDPGPARAVFYRPPPPLDRLIDGFWAADAYIARTPRERVLPDGAPVLVFHLGPGPLRMYSDERANESMMEAAGAVICGARQSPMVIDTAMGPTVGVHFKPGGSLPFLDARADAFAHGAVALDAVWGTWAKLVREQLEEACTPFERVRILEANLLARARRPLELSPVLRVALDAFEEPGLSSVAEINRRTGLSPKRLSALFKERVGLSPKTYWRVRRFRAVLRALDEGSLRGAALANELGYCDQPHFLRDFREFAAASPREYLATRVAGSDHMSLYG
jgi:AraC-like DNA-binding protein